MARRSIEGNRIPEAGGGTAINAEGIGFIADLLAVEGRSPQSETLEAEIARLSAAPLLLNQYLNGRSFAGHAAILVTDGIRFGGRVDRVLQTAEHRHRLNVAATQHPGNPVNRFRSLDVIFLPSLEPERFTPQADDIALAIDESEEKRELSNSGGDRSSAASATFPLVALIIALAIFIFCLAIN